MVRICMVVHKNYFQDTRVKRYTESLLKAGIAVDVICPIESYVVAIKQQEGLKVHTIPIHHGQKGRMSLMLEYGIALIIYFIMLSILHLRNHYQVIHIHNMPDILVFSAFVPKIMGARIILDIHDPMPEVFISKYGEQASRFAYKLICLQEKISCLFVDAIITANSNFRTNLINRGIPANKITVVNNFPDPVIFNRNNHQHELGLKDTYTMIYAGTIAPRYGLDVPIQAIPELIPVIQKICLVIIGPESGYKEELKQLAEQLGVSSHVKFLPVVPNKEVPRHLVQAEIGIYPARRDAHMDIATPTKVLEYAAMGIPIISSRLRIVEDMFDDGSIKFFEPGSVKQFTRCVLDLFINPPSCKELVHNANKTFVRKYSWNQEFRVYIHMINSLLPGKAEKIRLVEDK